MLFFVIINFFLSFFWIIRIFLFIFALSMNIDAITSKFGREMTRELSACSSIEELSRVMEHKGFSLEPQEYADILETLKLLHGTLRPLSDDELAKVTGG